MIREYGISRAFFITTTGVFSRYKSAADIYKYGEKRIKESDCLWTILRPSMIYGTERDRNMTKLLTYLNRYPVFPVFGSGKCLMQPVYVADLAEGILAALRNMNVTEKKEYNLCGPHAMPYIELLKKCCTALNRKVKFIHVPHTLAVCVANFGEKLPGFPIKAEQVMRLLEDKVFDVSLAENELGYMPRPFEEGIEAEVSRLKEIRRLI